MPSNHIVHDPRGYPPTIRQVKMAPRLTSLEGKTIYLIDARFDDSDRFLKQMQAWFGEHMPSVRTIFVQKDGTHSYDDPRLWAEIKANGDAAVMGVGH
jgi:hypothetical protein